LELKAINSKKSPIATPKMGSKGLASHHCLTLDFNRIGSPTIKQIRIVKAVRINPKRG
jgi:hypothetical protein